MMFSWLGKRLPGPEVNFDIIQGWLVKMNRCLASNKRGSGHGDYQFYTWFELKVLQASR